MARLQLSRAVLLAIAISIAGCGQGSNDGNGSTGEGGAEASGGTGAAHQGGSGAGGKGSGGSGGSVGEGGAIASGGTPGEGGGPAGGAGGGEGVDMGAPDVATPDTMGTGGAAGGSSGGPGKVVLVASGLPTPFGAAVDPMTGDIYVAEYGANRVDKLDAQGKPTTVVGTGAAGPGGKETLKQPHDLLFQPHTRNLFIADTFGGRVVRLDAATGDVTVYAGPGGKVPPLANHTYSLAFDAAGETFYFAGEAGIRVVDLKTDTVKATINFSNRVIAVDAKGTLYAVKGGGTDLMIVAANGNGTAVPGGGGLSAPKHITTDGEGNVIIADTESDSMKEYVLAQKKVIPLALDGVPGKPGLSRPHGVFVDGGGRILIADSFNGRVLAIVH